MGTSLALYRPHVPYTPDLDGPVVPVSDQELGWGDDPPPSTPEQLEWWRQNRHLIVLGWQIEIAAGTLHLRGRK